MSEQTPILEQIAEAASDYLGMTAPQMDAYVSDRQRYELREGLLDLIIKWRESKRTAVKS